MHACDAAGGKISTPPAGNWRIKITDELKNRRRTSVQPILFFGQFTIFPGIYTPRPLNIAPNLPSYTANNNTMNSKIYRGFPKAFLLSGAIFLGWAAHAQSTNTDNMSADTTNRKSMHRHWGNRNTPDGLATGDGFRQHRGTDGFGPGDRHKGIHYTPDQRKQAMAIISDYHIRSAELFKKDNITLKEYKAGLVALQKERRSKLEALLTQEQKDQLAERKKRGSENMQVRAAARMERLKLRLNLSDDQVAKLKSGQESFRAQIRSIHENQDLLPQQKIEQLKDLAAKRQDTFKSVLTPEQLSKFQEISHRHGSGRRGGEREQDYPSRHPLGDEAK
jgi:hypothetical protein